MRDACKNSVCVNDFNHVDEKDCSSKEGHDQCIGNAMF
jgi:hypothetical protein